MFQMGVPQLEYLQELKENIMIDYSEDINKYIEMEIETLKNLNKNEISDVINLIVSTYEKEGRIYIFGNGGSASTASHFTNDFNKGISEYLEKKFNFICLNDNVPTLLAIANDISYDEIFQFQLRGNLNPEDLVIGISGSGNSKNVLNALEYAKENGTTTLAITGYNGGIVKTISDYSLNTNINNMQITEDIHMFFDHLIMTVLYWRWNISKTKC